MYLILLNEIKRENNRDSIRSSAQIDPRFIRLAISAPESACMCVLLKDAAVMYQTVSRLVI